MAHARSQESGGSGWCLVAGPLAAAAVHACLWNQRWQWWLTPAAEARVGSALPPESMRAEKEAPMAVLSLSSRAPQQWRLALLAGPASFPYSLGCGTPHPSPLRLSPCSQPQSFPQLWPSKLEPQHPAPTHLSGWVSQAVECQAVAPIICAGLSPLCPPESGCCTLLQGSKAPALSWLVSLLVRGLPSVPKTFLCHSPLPGGQVPFWFLSLSFFSFFICPTQLCGDFLAFLEVWGLLPAFSKCSVRIVPHVDVFWCIYGRRCVTCPTPLPSWSSRLW